MENGNSSPKKIYNDCGEEISGFRLLLSDDYWNGKYEYSGEKQVDWEKYKTDDVDSCGFDKTQPIKRYTLPKGTIIIRYGSIIGYYTAPEGTPYEQLSLPYVKDTVEFHRYEVISQNGVPCEVYKGIVGHKFDSPGGGIQYHHLQSIMELLKDHIIREI